MGVTMQVVNPDRGRSVSIHVDCASVTNLTIYSFPQHTLGVHRQPSLTTIGSFFDQVDKLCHFSNKTNFVRLLRV